MKFKELKFDDANAQRVYANYIKEVRQAVKSLSSDEKEEVLMEFNSHIYENVTNDNSNPELEVLLNTIDKLGTPSEVLQPLVADKLLEKATRTFNPIHVFKALMLNLTNGVAYVIFAFLYLFLGTFIFLVFAKLFNQDVGMYFKDGQFALLGMTRDSTGYEEVLGHWFIPFVLLAILVTYFILTLFLKLKRSLNKK